MGIYHQYENYQRSAPRYETLTLVVKPKRTTTPVGIQAPKTSGFEILLGIVGVASAVCKRRAMKNRK